MAALDQARWRTNRGEFVTVTIAQEVRQIVSDIFNVPIDEVSETSSPNTLSNWDSLQHLNLVLALEQNFGLQLGPDEIEQLLSVGSIIEIVESKTKAERTG